MSILDEAMARLKALRESWNSRETQTLGAFLRPAYSRPELMRIFDPLVAIGAGIGLLSASALGFAAFGVLVACALIAYLIITQVFGISVELNPEMFR